MTTIERSSEHSAARWPHLAGRVVLVTGGGSGLGAATCTVLAEAGATVIVADVRPDRAERVSGKIRADCEADCCALPLDVTDERDAERAVRFAIERFGRLDVLVNNAGTDQTAPIEELTVADFDRVIATNLRGPFVLSRAAFGAMRETGGGHIVNIVSTAAKRAWANASAYHASKWGLLGLSHALHVEGRECGIAVTAIIAGGMRTPFLLDRFPDLDPELLQDPRSVAEAIRFAICQPAGTVIPEITVLPMRETSWP
jgi:NAD(P)-dependent dehydrogenase (short-subunit alcohol dehydrogenase family)